MKILFLFIFINLGLISYTMGQGFTKKTKEILKDYALCSCIIEGYKRDSIDIKDVSIAVLYDISGYNIDLLNRKQIDSLTSIVLNEIRPLQPADYGNRKPVIYTCLQYYKGKKLNALVRSMKKGNFD